MEKSCWKREQNSKQVSYEIYKIYHSSNRSAFILLGRKEDGSSTDQTDSLEENIQWYPQRKIDIAKRKLNRGNPASKWYQI